MLVIDLGCWEGRDLLHKILQNVYVFQQKNLFDFWKGKRDILIM